MEEGAEEFIETHLFEPLGIRSHDWFVKDGQGRLHTGGGLRLSARDMARFGFLLLNDGRWNGKQVVSREYLDRARAAHSRDVLYGLDYGYQIWIGSVGFRDRAVPVYSANGRGGQYILVVPEHDLVIVTTAWNVPDVGRATTLG